MQSLGQVNRIDVEKDIKPIFCKNEFLNPVTFILEIGMIIRPILEILWLKKDCKILSRLMKKNIELHDFKRRKIVIFVDVFN